MNIIWIIAKKELKTFYDSLIAYILLIAFLGLSGLFTWLMGGDVFFINQASLQSFFGIAYWTLFFFIPALTMKMLAEERKSGTIELLLTKSITDWQVVIGKFMACMLLILSALAFTLPYYITIASIGKIDHGAVLCGYLGLILMSAAYISIGIFTSSTTNNQIVAFLMAIFVGLFFHIIFDFLAQSLTGSMGELFSNLSLHTHFESMSRGVIDTKDLLYFFSIVFLGLVFAESSLSRRTIAD